ncbi:DUF3263 domain-containing protein [Hamadaea sp. NPDC050747]|uniref:DUF3263 domain-containing protein n=1 Tax=Hamadaea sp. NPDC050747 TaxID=3155789 RepID=UPI0033E76378
MAELDVHQQAIIPSQREESASGAEESDDFLDSDLPARPIPTQRVTLSERDQAILAFERQWWKHAGAKEQAIRETFEVSATRYYQLLNKLLDDPQALAYDAVLVNRLRRLRMSRGRSRA